MSAALGQARHFLKRYLAAAVIATALVPGPAPADGNCAMNVVLAIGLVSQMYQSEEGWQAALRSERGLESFYREMDACRLPAAQWRRAREVLAIPYADDTAAQIRTKARLSRIIGLYLARR